MRKQDKAEGSGETRPAPLQLRRKEAGKIGLDQYAHVKTHESGDEGESPECCLAQAFQAAGVHGGPL